MREIKKILVTGGAGFIGCNFVHMLLAERPRWQVVCLDALTYAGNLANLQGPLDNERFNFVKGDICDDQVVKEIMKGGVDAVVNFAAESHVGRGTLGCREFIRTNVEGAQVLLEAARQMKVGLFVQISTDEVYGSLGAEGYFTEETPIAPNSPYSASKAAIIALTQSLAHELEGTGVRANAVVPTTIDTPANRDAMPNAGFSSWTPPSEIARVAYWLASEAAATVIGGLIPV